MHKHLLIGLLGLVTLNASAAFAEIVAVKENGRTVYVDVPAPGKDQPGVFAAPAQYGARNIYLYYSKGEHRWKRVPQAAGATMRKARSAAADVERYIVWRQQQPAFRVSFGENAPICSNVQRRHFAPRSGAMGAARVGRWSRASRLRAVHS